MAVAVLAPAVFGGHPAATASPYKCYVGDSLYDGLVPGKVQAKKWKDVKSKSRRYKTLRKTHGLAVLTPCVVADFRATYTAMLKDAAGARVSTNVQRLGPLKAHAPCMFSIGGAPTGGRGFY
jgi:hypothetical protein